MADRRGKLKAIAQDTTRAIEHGSYTLDGTTYDLRSPTGHSKKNTTYYAPDSLLSSWATSPMQPDVHETQITFLEVSTLEGARFLHSTLHAATTPGAVTPIPQASHLSSQSSTSPGSAPAKVGILNFASARKPGGGFLSGAQAQEESIARSSTLYPTLMTRVAQAFYTLHNRDPKAGYYSHAMIYSPAVTVFREDDGSWVAPYEVDVLTSPAVNAGAVRQSLFGRVAGAGVDDKIAGVMRERMARILYLFEQQGVRHIVLGSFGTGVFKNKVETVGEIWADLLLKENARFRRSFEHVVFAVLGKQTYDTLKGSFEHSGTKNLI